MSAFAFVIRAGLPFEQKPINDVAAEDVHRYQPHCVDLELFDRAQELLHAVASGGLSDSPDPARQTGLSTLGIENTPQEEEGDVKYNQGVTPSMAAPVPPSSLLTPP